MRRQDLRIGLTVFAALATASSLVAQDNVASGQRVAFTERQVEIYDASGIVTLRRTTGNAITVTATQAGPDGSQLSFAADHDGERGRFRVVFPDVGTIAAPDGRSDGGSSELDLRRDGTFGGDNDYSGWNRRGRSDRVRIGGSRGLRGHATIEIGVPEGRSLKLHLAVGSVTVDGVSGDVVIDTWSASAEATNISGDWLFDAGSGNTTVRGMRGTLRIDTGSGSGIVSGMTAGDLLDIDTGSGNVDVTDVVVDRFRFDTGSGDVRARNITSRRGVADTGSGSVDLVYNGGTIEDLLIDTGSGEVTLTLPPSADARVSIETGSGDAVVNRAGAIYERRGDDGMVLRFGEGRGRIRIDTGSGDVTIR